MIRVLQVATHDVTVKKLLLPLIDRLTEEGYEVVSACSPGKYTPEMLAQGYQIRSINIDRRITPKSNARAIRELYQLLRKEPFDIVHVHTPVAAALGRVAAQLAGTPIIIYTAHGFYFHENMRWKTRKAYTVIEKLLGRFATDALFTQSQEDALTAVELGICKPEKVLWISNGVDISRFQPSPPAPEVKESYGIPAAAPVAGFIGRMVAEKGVVELLEAFEKVVAVMPDARLLMVGDITDGDRDTRTREIIRDKVEHGSLAIHVVFTGFVEDIPRVMRAMDVFVLPSHREGMPRSIIEAMASGKPVVATDIRGCREEVAHEQTGLLVPVQNAEALAQGIIRVLADPALAQRMGLEGRRRAEALFDERDVLERQAQVYRQLIQDQLDEDTDISKSAQPRPHSTKVRYGETHEVRKS